MQFVNTRSNRSIFIPDNSASPRDGLFHHISCLGQLARLDFERFDVAGEVIFKTRDGGQSWTIISPDLTRNDKTKQQWAGGPITYDLIFAHDTVVTDVTGFHTGTPGTTFTPTYDMTLVAGTYQVALVVDAGNQVLP